VNGRDCSIGLITVRWSTILGNSTILACSQPFADWKVLAEIAGNFGPTSIEAIDLDE